MCYVCYLLYSLLFYTFYPLWPVIILSEFFFVVVKQIQPLNWILNAYFVHFNLYLEKLAGNSQLNFFQEMTSLSLMLLLQDGVKLFPAVSKTVLSSKYFPQYRVWNSSIMTTLVLTRAEGAHFCRLYPWSLLLATAQSLQTQVRTGRLTSKSIASVSHSVFSSLQHLSISPFLVNKTPGYLNSSTWGSNFSQT